MNNKKVWGTILGVTAFIALVAGVTYAWFTWTSSNTVIGGTTGCFNIKYDKGADISGQELRPTSSYTGGASTIVKINIDSSCNITGTATLYLNTLSTTTVPLSASGALKYAVVHGGTKVADGTISAKSDLPILENIALTKAATATDAYTVYVWIDGTIADNTYAGKVYNGYIHAKANQTES